MAGVHRGGFQVAIALGACAFRGFVEQGVFQLHPVFRHQTGLGGPRDAPFSGSTGGRFRPMRRCSWTAPADRGPAWTRADAAHGAGSTCQRIVVEIAAVIVDAGDGQHRIGRVQRQLRGRHAHAVLRNALQAAGRNHLPAQTGRWYRPWPRWQSGWPDRPESRQGHSVPCWAVGRLSAPLSCARSASGVGGIGAQKHAQAVVDIAGQLVPGGRLVGAIQRLRARGRQDQAPEVLRGQFGIVERPAAPRRGGRSDSPSSPRNSRSGPEA